MEIFRKFDQNRNCSKFSNKSKIVQNFDKKSKSFDILTKIDFFSKNFTNIDIFRKFWQKSKFSKIWPKSKFSKIWPKSKFFEHFDQNRNYSKIWPLSKVFNILENLWNFSPNWNLTKIWAKSKFFENFTKIDIFETFDKNRNFFR